MTPHEIKRLTHRLFLALYYQTPVLRDDSDFRIAINGKNLAIEEPTDAILLILELVCADGDNFCFQGKLEDSVTWWYGVKTSSSFDKKLRILDDAGWIDKERNPHDKRENKLRLTPDGKRAAAKVRAQRARALDPLLKVLVDYGSSAQPALEDLLTTLAKTAQTRLRTSPKAEKKKKQPATASNGSPVN
jgi:DNA-binding PadR family transcriptional regulator